MYNSKEINRAIKILKQGDARWNDIGDSFQNAMFNVYAVSQLIKELEIEQSASLGTLIDAYTGKVRDSRSNDVLWTKKDLRSHFERYKELLDKYPPCVRLFEFVVDGRSFNLDISQNCVSIYEVDGSFASKTEFSSFYEALNEYLDVVDQADNQTFEVSRYVSKKIGLDAQIKQADEVRGQVDKLPEKQADKER